MIFHERKVQSRSPQFGSTRAGLVCSERVPKGRASSFFAPDRDIGFVSGTKSVRPRAPVKLNTRDETFRYHLSAMGANRQNGNLVWFSTRRRIEFDNPRWVDRWLACCLVYWVGEVGGDLIKFVQRVASPDAMRRERPNRYGRVSRHISHEFEIFKINFQTRIKLLRTISQCTSIIRPWF